MLAHEAWHLRGVRDEGTTECYALQSGVELGQRLGLSEDTARQMMRQQLVENRFAARRASSTSCPPDCRNGGALDLARGSDASPRRGRLRRAAPWYSPVRHREPRRHRHGHPNASAQGILSPDRADKRDEIIELLKTAYWMELETVMSYISNSVNPDGVRAQEIREALAEDIQEELGHAQQFADRIKELYGVVPGSLEFRAEQSYLQPPEEQTDVVHVIRGVIDAETGAIEHYNTIIEACDGVDWVTQDMVIDILRDEEGHRRLFEGFLREYEAEGLA